MESIRAFIDSYFRFDLWGLANVLAGSCFLAIGLFVFTRQTTSRVNRAYLLLTINIFFWTMGFGLGSLAESAEFGAPFYRYSFIFGTPFIPPAFYYFVGTWTDRRSGRLTLPAMYFLAAIFGFIGCFFGDALWRPVDTDWSLRYPLYWKTLPARSYIASLLVFFWGVVGMTGVHLYSAIRAERDPKRRKQLRLVFLAFLIGFTGGADFLTTLIGRPYPFGVVSLTLLIAVMAYSIVKHRLLDVKVVVKKISLVLVIYAALIAVLVMFGLPLARRIVAGAPGEITPILVLSLLFGVALSAGPILYATILRHGFWLKNHMSIGLTHELKSPLATIKSALDELINHLRDPRPDLGRSLAYAEIASKNSDRLELFIENLLNIVRVNEGTVDIAKSPCDIVKIVHETIEPYREQARFKRIRIEIESPDALTVEADDAKVRQAFSNILSNAVKYADSGAIHVSVCRMNGHVVVRTTDEGKGIEPTLLTRVFDKFVQVGKHGTGSGLGLSIAKAWVEAHGGRIWAESKGEGKGTTVTFTVPAA